jgi:single-strand DNA-binding protein
MAGETILTIVGNLTADPEVRSTQNGTNVANFTIASTPRTFNRNTNQFEDGAALFMRCAAWRELGDHAAASLHKGMRVIAQGRLSQRSYKANDGTNRTVVEMTVDEIGPSLSYATAQVTRTQNGNGAQRSNGAHAYGSTPQSAAWQQPGQSTAKAANGAQNDAPADPWGGNYTNDFAGGSNDDPAF